MLLIEIFSSNYNYSWIDNNTASFEINKDIFYRVKFIRVGGGEVEIMFSYNTSKGERSMDITNTGNASKIFSTVIRIVKEYLQNNNADTISFASNNSETSRNKLYSRLCQTLANGACRIADNGTEKFYIMDVKK